MRKRILTFFVFILASTSVITIQASASAESVTPLDGVDVMLVCAHPGDEYLFLGGVLPLYAGEQGRSTVVVYLCESNEESQSSAKKALLRFGDKAQAVFGSFSANYASTEEEQLQYWNSREVITYLVGIIRQYKPAVVLTHQPLGEYGNGAHIVASNSTFMAVRYAPDSGRYPESSASYGAWQVQRLFFHQYGENLITLDRSQPIARFNDMTALEMDQQGYACYPKTYPIKITDEAGYTSAQYGLASAVDEALFDPSKGDIFAGLDASLLGPTITPYIAPSPTPICTTTTESGIVISATSPIAVSVSEDITTATSTLIVILTICCGLVGFAALLGAIFQKKGSRFRVASIIICVAFLLGAVLLNIGCFRQNSVAAPKPEQLQTETVKTTPNPTNNVKVIVNSEPTPIPDPWDQYFRSASDPAEVVVIDPENEHWEYRSDKLSILIDRVHITKPNGKPITYCIANIRMRGEDAFLAGVRNDNPLEQPRLEHAWHMARRYRAILGITGDNLIQADVNEKGILMRNGKVYSINQAQDILAFYSSDLTVKIFKPRTISVEELKEQGVQNTFSFGPTMLNNGVRDLSSRRQRLGKQNPRCGIGMVEPGHFIAITVDGRQNNYSVGMSIEEFTQLFYLTGCQIAYNLDGGASTAMIFMGECLNQHSGINSDVQRPWTDGLFWGKSELVPTVDDPVYNDGSKPLVMPPT